MNPLISAASVIAAGLAVGFASIDLELVKVLLWVKSEDNRKQRILNTIRNSEELRGRAIEQLEKARDRLRKVEMEADQFLRNGYSEIERENGI
ncbi:hypothetical protein Nepgr_033980 [Nepenthes gracilis]|uniref:Uncharacterized protein n=1 Tax=Nepenthes gracilis TaxID=150966 RepID=A0AAD3TMV7_NEPGR|nr:hypothetical protein Nepgr_033980 [Nepenthes gracilis]